MLQNPVHYGIKYQDIHNDPSGHFILLEKVTEAAQALDRKHLIRYNQTTEGFFSTDMGRIASNYYINVETMSYFMANLQPHTSEEMFLYHLAHASEFKQLEARKEEMEELTHMFKTIRYVDVDKGEINESHAKVLILFENYLRKGMI